MKTLAVLAAALAISLTFAETASAGDSVVITKTSTDGFGNQKSVTRRHNSDGTDSVSVTKSGKDVFGNQKSVTSKITDNGSVRCKTVSSRTTDSFGDSASRTSRRCAADF